MISIRKYLRGRQDILLLGLLVVSLTAGLFISSVIKARSLEDQKQINEYTHFGIKVASSLSQESSEEVAGFIKVNFSENSLPTDLKLTKQAKVSNNPGDEYVGGWSKDGKLFNVLYVLDPSTKQALYLRGWFIDIERKLTSDQANTLLKSSFSGSAISASGSVNCQEVSDPQGAATVCAAMAVQPDNSKSGVLVKSPIKLGSESNGTVVSICNIPKESSLNYGAGFCF